MLLGKQHRLNSKKKLIRIYGNVKSVTALKVIVDCFAPEGICLVLRAEAVWSNIGLIKNK